MKTLSDQLLAVAHRFAEAEGKDLASASYHAFGDSRILPRIAAEAASTTLRRADDALQWFSDHWPDAALWPDDVPRPSHSVSAPMPAAPAPAEASHP